MLNKFCIELMYQFDRTSVNVILTSIGHSCVDFMKLNDEYNDVHFYLFLVHPCDQPHRGGCKQICNKKGKRYSCSCDADFKLEPDDRSCAKSKFCFPV